MLTVDDDGSLPVRHETLLTKCRSSRQLVLPNALFPAFPLLLVRSFTDGSVVDHGVLSFYMIYLNVIEHCYLILVSTVCIYSN